MKKFFTLLFFILNVYFVVGQIVAPTLYSPAHTSTQYNVAPLLKWYNQTGATFYLYEYDTTANFNSIHYRSGEVNAASGTYTSVSLTNLQYGKLYYWRIASSNTTDTVWSIPWAFTTAENVNLYTPADNIVNSSVSQTFRWYNFPGSYFYNFELDTTPQFDSTILLDTFLIYNTSDYRSFTVANLQYGTTYYWRVRALNAVDTSHWSAIRHFTTLFEISTAPTLLSPANNSEEVSWENLVLTWSNVDNATNYQYQVATDVLFTNLLANGMVTGTNAIVNLAPNTLCYWRVVAENANGSSPWSVSWSFTTVSLPQTDTLSAPILLSPANNSLELDYHGIDLCWDSVENAIFYEYSIADNINFDNAVIGTTSELSFYTGELLESTVYFWKVRAGNSTIYSDWSTIWYFSTDFDDAIDFYHKDENYKVYPNPASTMIYIEAINVNSALYEIAIIDVRGVCVFSQSVVNEISFNVNIEYLSKGIYYVVIKDRFGKKSLPLIVQ